MKIEEVMDIKDPVRRLERIMRILRAPEGCPWDRKQTLETLTRYMREECAEVVDAVMDKDYENLCDELGDLLMNIVFSSVVAEEQELFSFDDVAAASVAKMIRRHPHVFSDVQANSAEQVLTQWEKIKLQEKDNRPPESLLDGIPRSHSALMLAENVQKRVAKVGFDWPEELQILDKIEEEIREIRAAYASGNEEHIDEEIGDLLFAAVNLPRYRKRAMAEDLLHSSIKKFERRFRFVEKKLKEAGTTPEKASLEQMESLWQRAKKESL